MDARNNDFDFDFEPIGQAMMYSICERHLLS